MHSAYTLIKKEYLADLSSTGYLFQHNKTKARVTYLECDDDNKVFYIGFRTPPTDSTGVAHITEHSVLCGSDKYPVKDPFVELAKGSLNTFLNAMTYPDKTLYPVASTNDKDFANLMDVYLDAVFHPDIYNHEEIFQQEGWHYEMESVDSELTINGVVYNEMKGAFSSPDSVFDRVVLNTLFPDNTYSIESGGDPKNIPDLTYEDFKAFHSKFYHPSNSYIYLYGQMDIDEKLDYLDREYLSHYDYLEVDSMIPLQKAFDKTKYINKEYSVSEGMPTENATYISKNYCLGDCLDAKLYCAFDILEYALFASNGAPVKKALLDAGIGEEIMGSYSNGTRQNYFTILARGANESDESEFLRIVDETLRGEVKNGINKGSILAAINHGQFRIREADFGNYPKGLMYGLSLMDSWLYDENDPFLFANNVQVLDELKELIDKGYFESLVDKYFLSNPHSTVVTLKPKTGLTAIEDEELRVKLAKIKAGLNKEEIEKIVQQTAHLKEYQDTPSSQEDLEKIPLLSREDLSKSVKPIDLEVRKIGDTTVLFHDVNTNGISYLEMLYDVSGATLEDLPYIQLITSFFGNVDTEKYSYMELSDEIMLNMGGLVPDLTCRNVAKDSNRICIHFEVKAKYLTNQFDKTVELIDEMMLKSDYSDKKRIKELLVQMKSSMEAAMSSGGHTLAVNRAMKSFSKRDLVVDRIEKLSFYRFVKDIINNFDERYDEVILKCRELSNRIFTLDNLIVSITGKEDNFAQMSRLVDEFKPRLNKGKAFGAPENYELKKVNEGIKDASQIQYVCRAGNFVDAGFKYTGAFKVLHTILGYDYFWINVRIKGGAYGCMSNFSRDGETFFVSYRDPKLKETYDVFEAAADYIESFDVSDRDMTKFIIGTISGMDTPLTPLRRGQRGMVSYLTEVGVDTLIKEREEVINCTVQDIRALAPAIRAMMKQNHTCVVGNESKIEENADMFDEVFSLMG